MVPQTRAPHAPTSDAGRAAVLRGLVAVVVTYWIGLAVVALWRPVSLYRAALRAGTGRATLGFHDRYGLSVTVDQQAIWRADLTWVAAIAWFVGPPLLIWLVWAAWAARQGRRRREVPGGRTPASPQPSPDDAAPDPLQVRGGEPPSAERVAAPNAREHAG